MKQKKTEMVKQATTDLIAQEGFKPILYTVLALFALSILDWDFLLFLGVIFLLGELLFFYNPEREAEESDESAIISPLDGKITDVKYNEDNIEITIENTIVDPHFIRSPIGITVESVDYTRGLFLPTSNDKAVSLNERATISFNHKRKKFSLFLQSGYAKVPISFYPEEKEKVAVSKRIGFFGGGIGILRCPLNSEIKVSSGINIKAGETLLGFVK